MTGQDLIPAYIVPTFPLRSTTRDVFYKVLKYLSVLFRHLSNYKGNE